MFRGKKETSDSIEHMWTRLKTPGNGIVYEINRDHLLVDQIFAEAPEIRGKLETLLKYIERGIPLNQLYIDLNNDFDTGRMFELSLAVQILCCRNIEP